jgi:tRNA A37 threonylcarbamoyladenosine modification protein TsaB
MLDARKGRVYASLYDKDGACVMGPEDLPPEQALQWLHGVEGDVVCMGEGALRYQEQIESDGRTIANQVDDPAVDVLAELGESAIFRGEGCSPQDLQAMYVRIPDALRTKDRSSKSKVISGSQ